jgi:hypothetical protein
LFFLCNIAYPSKVGKRTLFSPRNADAGRTKLFSLQSKSRDSVRGSLCSLARLQQSCCRVGKGKAQSIYLRDSQRVGTRPAALKRFVTFL